MTAVSAPVVVITGASAGVGRATARAFAQRGYDVALLARGHDGLEATRREIVAMGRRALAVPCDVAVAAQVDAAAEQVESTLGAIEVWVNCAFASVFAMFEDVEAVDYDRATAVTYLGTVNGTRAALRRMKPRGRGTIVQVSSALAFRSIPLQSVYCGAKAAIRGFTDSVRCELRSTKSAVHLSLVCLPALNTPQFDWVQNQLPRRARPVAPVYQPEVAARAIVWAAVHRRREVLVGFSSVLAVVFAAKLFPTIGDWVLGRTGVQAQQTRELNEPPKPTNLFRPIVGDHGAHGHFDAEARDPALETFVTLHAGLASLIAALVALVVVTLLLLRIRS